ncbi:MAG: NAD(P)H-dependent oxidoreductase [Pseudomonadota bacterium]
MPRTVLQVDTSARFSESISRPLTRKLSNGLALDASRLIRRDLAKSPPSPITEAWMESAALPERDRTARQQDALLESDTLIAELELACTLVIGLPVYNFGPPSVFKAWIDQIARAGRTFDYIDGRSVGLVRNKAAYILATSASDRGADVQGAIDFAYRALAFLGIENVLTISAEGVGALLDIENQIDAIIARPKSPQSLASGAGGPRTLAGARSDPLALDHGQNAIR